MTNSYTLGKVSLNGSGRRINRAAITWSLEGGRFSMQAEVWNGNGTDIVMGGQCVDEVAAMFPEDAKAQRMLAVWRAYHLNDMKAGSPAQEAELTRHTFPGYPVSHYDWAREVLTSAGLQPDASYLHNGAPYSYGSAWLSSPIPAEVVAEIESWSAK